MISLPFSDCSSIEGRGRTIRKGSAASPPDRPISCCREISDTPHPGFYHHRPPQKTKAYLKDHQFLCKKNHCCLFQTVEKMAVAAFESRPPRNRIWRFNSVSSAIARFFSICIIEIRLSLSRTMNFTCRWLSKQMILKCFQWFIRIKRHYTR